MNNILEWLTGNGEGFKATGQGKAPDEGHNRHRVFRGACKRKRMDKDLPIHGGNRETVASILGIASRDTLT